MFFLNKAEHALITVYGDRDGLVERIIGDFIPDRELRILTPKDIKTLEQAAQNSVLAFIVIAGKDDPNLATAKVLKESRLVSCDVVACQLERDCLPNIRLLGMGFDLCVGPEEMREPDFRTFLMQKIGTGSRRLTRLILEEEYRRVCDALSSAPASIMIFDADKRAVFISDHYFRSYPKIAGRLVRGLSVYEAFDLMAKEEGLQPEDPVYESLQRFWYTLDGSIEFTLKDVSYKLKAVQLPSRRGSVLMAQNVSKYHQVRTMLEEQTTVLMAQLEDLKSKKEIV